MLYQEIQFFEESPHSKLYLQNPEVTSSVQKKRPILVVCPGGGYVYSATREGEAVALHFLAKGYNVAVLRYRTYLGERLEATKGIPKVNPQASFTGYVRDLMETMRLINQHHDDWQVDKDNIFVMGFSAGGHLTAFLGTQWDNETFIKRFYKLGSLCRRGNSHVCLRCTRASGLS